MRIYFKFLLSLTLSLFMINTAIFSQTNTSLYTFGGNADGQLGNGSFVSPVNAPAKIENYHNWKMVTAGGRFSLAIRQDGTLWAWGHNDGGNLGNGNNTNQNIPIQIGNENHWKHVSAGNGHALAIKDDGTLWAWGWNAYGQVGDNSITDRNAPIQIGNNNDWKVISAGIYHSLAIKTDGTLWAWGANSVGQLGDDTFDPQNAPIQIGSDNNWKDIAAGSDHSLAIKTDGTIWAWGSNSEGQLGNGSFGGNVKIPTKIGTDNDWNIISSGAYYCMAIKTDGTIWAWGSNSVGQLGNGSNTSENAPIKIGSNYDWSAVSTGWYHTLAIKNDGSLWAWGSNSEGQLGNGSNTSENAPTQIGNDNNWKAVSAGYNHSATFKGEQIVLATISDPIKTSGVTKTNVVSGAVVLTDGDGTILERGICYSTSRYPTISGDHVEADEIEIGTFTVTIQNLSAGTKYYVRPYVTNEAGTVYGNERAFTTQPNN